MKLTSVKGNSIKAGALNGLIFGVLFGLPYAILKTNSALITIIVMMISLLFAISYHKSPTFIFLLVVIVMFSMVAVFKYGIFKEGFLNSSPEEIIDQMRKMKPGDLKKEGSP